MSRFGAATRLAHAGGPPDARGGYGGRVPLDPVGQRAAELDTSWKNRAACAHLDDNEVEWFFPPDGHWNDDEDTLRTRKAVTDRRAILAKQVCARCPVIGECATYALTVREPWGVWGGLDQGERERLLSVGRGKRGGS